MTPSPHALRILLLVTLAAVAALTGCESAYRTPGRGADFDVFMNEDIEIILERKPAASWPAHLALVRIQEPGYRSATAESYGQGSYSIVGVRDVETDEDVKRLEGMPGVAQVVWLNRLLVTGKLDTDRPLRQAAATLHADILCMYTLDTRFYVSDPLKPLTVISLGLTPHRTVHVTTTASAILVDVRTGYVYGACETTAQQDRLASAWTDGNAVDATRRQTERESFAALLDDIESLWGTIAQTQANQGGG